MKLISFNCFKMNRNTFPNRPLIYLNVILNLRNMRNMREHELHNWGSTCQLPVCGQHWYFNIMMHCLFLAYTWNPVWMAYLLGTNHHVTRTTCLNDSVFETQRQNQIPCLQKHCMVLEIPSIHFLNHLTSSVSQECWSLSQLSLGGRYKKYGG